MPPICICPRGGPLCEECLALESLRPLVRAMVADLARGSGGFLREEDCQDITQDVMLALFKGGHTHGVTAALLTSIVHGRWVDWIRASASRACSCIGGTIYDQPARDQLSDLALDLIEALDGMPQNMRAVFIACGIERWTLDETVERLGLTLHKVRRLYAAAIRLVAQVLEIAIPEQSQPKRAKKSGSDDIAC